jgi:hypothetical protein
MVGCLPLAETARTTKNANNAREAAPVVAICGRRLESGRDRDDESGAV